jgi:DNA-binding transcriptional LysR family regulator
MSYLSSHGTPHALSELERHTCLQGNLDYWRFQEADNPRIVRVSGNIRSDSGRALLDAVLKGIDIVQLPDYYVQPALDSSALIPLLTHFQEDDNGIWAVYPHNCHLSPKVRMLLDFFAESLGSHPIQRRCFCSDKNFHSQSLPNKNRFTVGA